MASMQPAKGRGLGRRLVGRPGAGGDVSAAVFGGDDIVGAANHGVAEALEHEGDFGAEGVAGHRAERLEARRHGGVEAEKFLPAQFLCGGGETHWRHCTLLRISITWPHSSQGISALSSSCAFAQSKIFHMASLHGRLHPGQMMFGC
jgi:hypothetical protein